MSDRRVYFIKPEGMDGPVKIGCSTAPERRVSELNTWVPFRLELVACAPGEMDMEKRVHYLFAATRLRGEWFNASLALAAFIEHVAAHGALPDVPRLPEKSVEPAELRPVDLDARRAKATATRLLNRAQVYAFGWWERPPFPPHIQKIKDRLPGGESDPPSASEWAAIDEYCAEMRARPAAPDALYNELAWLRFRRDHGIPLSPYRMKRLDAAEQARAA